MKSMDDLKLILPKAKDTLKISQTFEDILGEREKTKQPRLVFLEQCLLSIKEQIELVSVQGNHSLVFSIPELHPSLDQFTTYMELQSLLHEAGYGAGLYPAKNEIVIKWKR